MAEFIGLEYKDEERGSSGSQHVSGICVHGSRKTRWCLEDVVDPVKELMRTKIDSASIFQSATVGTFTQSHLQHTSMVRRIRMQKYVSNKLLGKSWNNYR